MPSCEGFVATDRAQRYVTQLRSHFAHQPAGIRAVSDDEGDVLVDLGRTTCWLRARPEGLQLLAEAPDIEQLDWARRGVARRLEQIGRRDGLVVRWGPVTAVERPDEATRQEGLAHG